MSLMNLYYMSLTNDLQLTATLVHCVADFLKFMG